ncbi:unnamed protein product [Schistocephalus solidus]|uniref:Sushi domain-containing protein n=1 Tax=Schistocephalus solidus TaxID=70667 RepID=A0A3P7EKU9_SCHSO|nr:unnamed protein product [Schistocephalus solidus]
MPAYLETFCQLDILVLCNARPDSIWPQNQTRFKYGEQVFFDCAMGYASADNNTLSRTSMTCRTMPAQQQSGVWIPGPCQACVVTRCNETEMIAMVPRFGKLNGARSKLTEEQYGELQVSQFNRFGNVVTFKCDDGYFFKDRTFQKFIECGLVEGTTSQGTWTGYSGTQLPLPKSCAPITCMYEDAQMKPKDKLQSNFTITFTNGTRYTLTKLQPREYPYKTVIRYVCQDGYETITRNSDQNITCGEMGKWRPQLTSCLEIPGNLNTTADGRYVPPAIEAPSANQVGIVVSSIIVAFLVALLLLDLATLKRDISWLFNNIRLQKRLWQAKRRIRAAKKKQQENQSEVCEKTE